MTEQTQSVTDPVVEEREALIEDFTNRLMNGDLDDENDIEEFINNVSDWFMTVDVLRAALRAIIRLNARINQ